MDALTIFAVIFSVYAFYAGLQFYLATKAPVVVIVGGSMRPTLEHGDLVVIKGVPATNIHRGDIIAFGHTIEYEQGNTTAIWPFTVYTVHRVVNIRSLANGTILFTTKGDNNRIIDARPVPDLRVQGRVIHRIPYLGYLFQDPAITFTMTTIVAIIVLIWPEKKRGFRRPKRMKKMKFKIFSSLFLILSLTTITMTELMPYLVSARFVGVGELVDSVNSEIINVPEDFPSIQKAINAANDGDIISVEAGKYREHIYVNKSVTLLGKGAIIDGKRTGNVISVTEDYVEITGFIIQKGYRGIFLSECIGSTIRNNTLISHTGSAIELQDSNRTIINSNTILNSNHAIYLLYSSCSNIISYNNVTNNSQGIALSWHCNNNTIIGNTVTSNSFAGIVMGGSNNNTIYHNKFIDNPEQVYSYNSTNKWDNGAEGNYWSDYKGKDQNGDGIGDTRLPHKGFDHQPLMEPWSMKRVFDIPWGNETYHVTTLCNSTVASFIFNETLKKINFNVTGPLGRVGFCDISIPKNILWTDSLEDWLIEFDGNNTTATIVENATHTSLSLLYTHGPRTPTHTVKIMGTFAILDTTPPLANVGPNHTILEDEPVSFDASASSDNIRIVRYEWDFGDGTTGKGITTAHIYKDPGTYNVTLTVRDKTGNNARDIATITVLRDTDGDWTPDITDTDDDNDGMPDVWEWEKGLNPLQIDAYLDPDNDGIINLEEYLRGTNPLQPDSDRDLWTDSLDIMPKEALIPNALIIATATIISALIMMRKENKETLRR